MRLPTVLLALLLAGLAAGIFALEFLNTEAVEVSAPLQETPPPLTDITESAPPVTAEPAAPAIPEPITPNIEPPPAILDSTDTEPALLSPLSEEQVSKISGLCHDRPTFSESMCSCMIKKAQAQLNEEEGNLLIATIIGDQETLEKAHDTLSENDTLKVQTFFQHIPIECAEATGMTPPSDTEAPVTP